MIDHWDRHFLDMCRLVSNMSKDPSIKTGAVIVRPDKTVVSTGFNGFPKQMTDTLEFYQDRTEKLSRIVHCEMNALIHAYEKLEGFTLYTTPFISCDRCFVHMVQAGIKRFVAPVATEDQLVRWADAFERTRQYARDAGVELVEVDNDTA